MPSLVLCPQVPTNTVHTGVPPMLHPQVLPHAVPTSAFPHKHLPILLTATVGKDYGIDSGGRMDISVSCLCNKDVVEAVAADIVQLNPHLAAWLNPHLAVKSLMSKAKFDKDGALQNW